MVASLPDLETTVTLARPFWREKTEIGLLPLRKEGFFLFNVDHRPPYAYFGQELDWTECGLLWPIHRQAFSAQIRASARCALSEKRCSLSGDQNSRLIAREILRRLSKSRDYLDRWAMNH